MSAHRARGSVLLGIWSEAATGPERYLGVDGKVYYSEALEVVQAYVACPSQRNRKR